MPGREIDQQYKALRELVGTGPGAPLDQLMKTVVDLQQQLAKLAAAGFWIGPPPGTDKDNPALALRVQALRQPQPVSRWLTTAADGGLALRGGDARQQVIAAYNAADGPAAQCAAIIGLYPFAPGSARELSLDDFAHLFAPGGVLDGFFNTLLTSYIDSNASIWKPQSAGNSPPPVGPADAMQFQRAAQIRDLFFPSGQTSPELHLDIQPISLDTRASQVTLELDGTTITYSRGDVHSTEIIWPAANPAAIARLSLDPPPAGTAGSWQDTGSWALFRLLSRGKMVPGREAGQWTLTLQMGDRQAVFDIRTGTRDPLVHGILEAFRCPAVH